MSNVLPTTSSSAGEPAYESDYDPADDPIDDSAEESDSDDPVDDSAEKPADKSGAPGQPSDNYNRQRRINKDPRYFDLKVCLRATQLLP